MSRQSLCRNFIRIIFLKNYAKKQQHQQQKEDSFIVLNLLSSYGVKICP